MACMPDPHGRRDPPMHSQRMGALICLLLSMLIALCPAALPLHAVAEEENVIYYIEMCIRDRV